MMDKETFADIVFGRISDSIRHDLSTGTTKSHKQYIKNTIQNREYMIKHLKSVLEKDFPQYMEYFEKLMVLR